MILWYKNMNIYNHQPPLHTITPPRPHYKKGEKNKKLLTRTDRHIIFYTVNITATNCGSIKYPC